MYRKKPHHHCCESGYLSLANSSDPVCCSGKLLPALPEHRCCGGYHLRVQTSEFRQLHLSYARTAFTPFCLNESRSSTCVLAVLVFADETCCPDPTWGRVSVGLGDSCCGAVPYATGGGQLCCSGSLHDGYGVQCCGGRVVDEKLVCCGDAERGEVHSYVPGEGCKETRICSYRSCK